MTYETLQSCKFKTSPEENRIARWLVLVSLVITNLFLGCNSVGVKASRLPDNLRAARRDRSTVVDFSRISTPGINESTIGPRDLLKITVSSGRHDERVAPHSVRVAQNGTVNVPLIGPTMVAGLQTHTAGQTIAQSAIERGIYVRPYVTVEIEAKATRSVTVLGAVNDPGVHELPYGNSNLVTALAAAGGLANDASTEVEIIRQPSFRLAESYSSNDEVQQASYDVATAGTSAAGQRSRLQVMRLELSSAKLQRGADTRLLDRDIIKVVPRQDETVFVAGLVNKPGQYELPPDQDVHLLDAIAMAGGESSSVADKLLIIRRVEGRPEPVLINASLSAAKRNGRENIRLSPGDTISIEQTPATVVVEALKNVFRISFGLAGRTTVF